MGRDEGNEPSWRRLADPKRLKDLRVGQYSARFARNDYRSRYQGQGHGSTNGHSANPDERGDPPFPEAADHGWEIVPGNTIRNADYLAEDNGNENEPEKSSSRWLPTKATDLVKPKPLNWSVTISPTAAKSSHLVGTWAGLEPVSNRRLHDGQSAQALLINQKCVVTGRHSISRAARSPCSL
jgi:hypothetical protein